MTQPKKKLVAQWLGDLVSSTTDDEAKQLFLRLSPRSHTRMDTDRLREQAALLAMREICQPYREAERSTNLVRFLKSNSLKVAWLRRTLGAHGVFLDGAGHSKERCAVALVRHWTEGLAAGCSRCAALAADAALQA
eukprot:1455762-Prymnesium_polylepis.1